MVVLSACSWKKPVLLCSASPSHIWEEPVPDVTMDTAFALPCTAGEQHDVEQLDNCSLHLMLVCAQHATGNRTGFNSPP